jgi:hypothetical protein
MRYKLMSVMTFVIMAICVYGPNIPSTNYAYSPDVPEEIKKLRKAD